MRPLGPVLVIFILALSGCSAIPAGVTLSNTATTPSVTTTAPLDDSAPMTPTRIPTAGTNGLPTPNTATFDLKQDFYLETPRGAKIFLRTPAPPPIEVESLRNQLKIEPVSYLVARIDNTLGSGEANLESVTLYDSEGNTYKFTSVTSHHIGEWGPFTTHAGPKLSDGTPLSKDRYQALKSRVHTLEQALDAGIARQAHGNIWLLSKSTNLPEEVVRVMVKADGTPNRIHAYPNGVQGYATER